VSEIIDAVNRFRAQLLSADRATRLEMARRWLAVENALAPQVDALVMEILASPTPLTNWQIARLRRYRALMEQIDEQLRRYGATSATTIAERQRQLVSLAQDHAVGMAEAQAGPAIRNQFDRLPVRATENMIGVIGNGTPLNAVLADASRIGPDALGGELVNGIALGLNPREIARRALRRGLAQSYVRMTTIARTETLRVYRETTLESYRRSNVVVGYKRIASKSIRTCLGCLMADGMIYRLESEFEEHVNGRCVAIPILRDMSEPTWTTGRQWFEQQPPTVQREMMGNGLYNIWQSGRVDLSEMWRRIEDPTWGNSIVPARVRDFEGRI